MYRLQITAIGESGDVLEIAESPAPAPGPGQVLVQVEAATVNASDFLYISGQYSITPQVPSDVGAEGVGRVLAVGPGKNEALVGARVLLLPTYRHGTLIPAVDFARFFQMASWKATLELAEINAPHGFMRYYSSDVTAIMSGSTSFWKATQYLMGNHTIAERMFRHDPSVMLHAPLRTLLYADADGDTMFTVNQPSLLFYSYDNPAIAAVGQELDALVVGLIELLGGEVPKQLCNHVN